MSELPTFDGRPSVDTESWELRICGSVAEDHALPLSTLRDHTLETRTDEFDCLEGWTAENLSWRGVPVDDLLTRADPSEGSSHALVRAMDGDYACSFALNRLAEALIAVELDGEPLAVEHGGPARLVLPNDESQCWESVKWVEEIRVRESRPEAADTAEEIATARID